jgi:hypothetical protein
MKNSFVLPAVLVLSAITPLSPLSAQIADGSFETQAPAEIGGSNPGYCYGNGGGGGAFECANINSPWFAASGGGYQLETNSAWPGTPTPDGSYYAFIQNGGSVNQQFSVGVTGTYVIDFLVAGRDNQQYTGNEFYEVLLDGSPIFSDSTVTSQPFTARTTNPFDLVAGTLYSLSFHGLNFTGDNTAYIDAVSLSPAGVPEPSTWAMMLLGLGAIGVTARRRRALRDLDATA